MPLILKVSYNEIELLNGVNNMAVLKFRNINKIYDNNVQAVFDFNLDIDDKEFIVFVGPSGCGKSTTLRMVAGLENITSGELYIDNTLVNNVEPKDRDISMVFQNYALYPHMTVYGNMSFALKLRKTPRPLYEENLEAEALLKKNLEILKHIKKLYKSTKKKNEAKEIFDEIEFLYNQVFARDAEMQKMLVQKVGIYEERIKLLEKTAKKLQKDITRYQRAIEVEKDEECLKIFSDGLSQKEGQLEGTFKEIEYLKNHEVPLLKTRKLTKYEIDLEIQKTARILDLTPYLFRKPAALSGGQRQRVALGRAIVRKPKVFLMDEPLSNLDAKLRVQTRSEISKIHKRVGATTIYVTHDQTEAMTMADRIVVMKDGYIQQVGSPEEIYSDPVNVFVAGFIGTPPMNFLEAHFDGERVLISEGEKKAELKISSAQKKMLSQFKDGAYDLVIGIRPEEIELLDGNDRDDCQKFQIIVDFRELLGYDSVVYTYLFGQKICFKAANQTKIKADDQLTIGIKTKALLFFNQESSERIAFVNKKQAQ